MTHTLSVSTGESEGEEGGERVGGAAVPVLHAHTKGHAKQRHTLREGELGVVFEWVPGDVGIDSVGGTT